MRGHAEVAGGGFAGLTVAIALVQRGWTARVHERSSGAQGDGAGIFLWENGLRALQALGLELHDLVDAHEASHWEERDETGRVIGKRALPLPGGVRMVTLARRDLHGALLRAAREAGVSVRRGSAGATADPDGTLVTADGTSWPADVVIGADGIHSAVRDSLGLLDRHELFEPFRIFRFLTPLARVPERDGEWRNYVDHWNLSTRRRVLYVPCNERDLYLMLAARADDTEAVSQPLSPAVWCESFPRLTPVLSELPPTPHVDRYEAVRARAWSSGRVAIVGDAAHAMPPTMGQGAGTAMINALSLASALSSCELVEDALANWEQAERPETEAIQLASIARLETLFPEPGERRDSWDARPLRAASRSVV
jgi:2-methyl-3-hydroxypyridine 5-carboxylic acid dioxygenase